MFLVFSGLESHGDFAFGAVSGKRAALLTLRRFVDLRIYVVPKVGGGVGAYMYVPPQRVWFGAILVWNRERFSTELRERVNVKKKKSPDRRLVCIVLIPNERTK